MDGARLSRFPHLSWLGVGFEAGAGPLAFHLHATAHAISVASTGRHAVRWFHRAREARWITNERCVTCIPAHDDRHEFVVDAVSARYAIRSLSIDLGFSSQSHFTRLFSDLVGMTPARYRREFKPIVG